MHSRLRNIMYAERAEICYTPPNMERFIGYFHSSGTSASQSKVTGACRAARKRGWSVLRFDLRSVAQVRADLGYWKPDGCIVDAVAARSDLLRLREFSQLPTVFIDDNLRTSRKGGSTRVQDADRLAEEAADELLRHDLASYAFASWPNRRFWNIFREKAFLRALDRRHVKPSVFRPAVNNRNRYSVVAELAKWIRTLPLPAGIFTACDPMSEQILEAARANALDVPNDLMVIGVDDEEFFCENAKPTLSSISLGFESVGEQAIGILERQLTAGRHKPIHALFQDIHVVTRSSTRRTSNSSKTVTEALDLIRERACEGLTVADVLARFDCSRRLAEQRFQTVTGHSILAEIHAIQIEQAKRLIANPSQKLTAVPQLCGHRSSPFFQKLFKRTTGFSMSEWRDKLSQRHVSPFRTPEK